jgi:hypothetical protein
MKSYFFYRFILAVSVLLVSIVSTHAQDELCTLLDPSGGCITIDPIVLPVNDGVITVDDAFLANVDANAHVKLIIPTGHYTAAKFENLNFCRITIQKAEGGETTFSGYSFPDPGSAKPTIEILNCHNLDFDGHGIKVLDAYGSGMPDGPNQQAVSIRKASSYIEIHHLDIQNPSGFAGIMAKDSPECNENDNPVDIANPGVPYMEHIYIHHNYIHNIRQGEGIYAGDTGFLTGRVRGDCRRLFPQKIENVCIYENFLEEIGLDAIQLGSCITGGKIYKNFIVEYGTVGDGGMSNGIQIGLGNIGTVCERNFIRQSAERSEKAGHGILCQGAGNNTIRDNIIYNTQENAIYVAEQTAYCYRENGTDITCTPVLGDNNATCKGYAYFDANTANTHRG